MRICHFSDWHGQYRMLPKADLYVCTGDMLPNFPLIRFRRGMGHAETVWDPYANLLGRDRDPKPDAYPVGRIIDPVREAGMQRGWLDLEARKGGLRRWLASPEAPVIVVRGNHDFTDLGPYFGGDVWEIDTDQTRTHEVLGLRFGGCRGINYIAGEWSDELHAPEWSDRMRAVPEDLDVLVTHAPPRNILDAYFAEHYGSDAVYAYCNRRWMKGQPQLRAHLFGHIHEDSGSRNIGGTLFSNAATTHIVHEI